MNQPIMLLKQWLLEENLKGAPNPQQAVLCTVSENTNPSGRVVAIREINSQELLFFTQKGTRKVEELYKNPNAVIVFWFELFQREVIIEGIVEPLTATENHFYWQSYPREAQIRFSAYAPTSSQPIVSKQELQIKKKNIEEEYQNKELPFNLFYCGFRLKPTRILFYSYRTDELSDVVEYQYANSEWVMRLLSP